MIKILSFFITLVPVLISVAMLTAIERKTMGSMQRRLGPNTSGYSGIAQPIADGFKLAIKQFILPYKGIPLLFIISAIISFGISISIWLLLPFSYSIFNFHHNILIVLALTSLSIYGILLSGYSSNCTYALLGSIRSAAQLISYELSFTLLLISVILSESYLFQDIVMSQTYVYNFIIYWPVTLLYFITILAETNRAPFDLPEAESELVSGFNTEHSGLPFAYFFLAEYSFIISQSAIFTFVLLGGPFIPFIHLPVYLYPFIIIFKTSFVMFLFVYLRATLPRFRYDLLQYFAWNIILPIAIFYITINFISI